MRIQRCLECVAVFGPGTEHILLAPLTPHAATSSSYAGPFCRQLRVEDDAERQAVER